MRRLYGHVESYPRAVPAESAIHSCVSCYLSTHVLAGCWVARSRGKQGQSRGSEELAAANGGRVKSAVVRTSEQYLSDQLRPSCSLVLLFVPLPRLSACLLRPVCFRRPHRQTARWLSSVPRAVLANRYVASWISSSSSSYCVVDAMQFIECLLTRRAALASPQAQPECHGPPSV